MQHETLTAFSELARELKLLCRTVSDREMELANDRYVIRVSEEIDRINGIFVTLARCESRNRQIGLSYLIEFRGGPRVEVEITAGNNVNMICALVRRYVANFLSGEADDFEELERFARQKIEERFPETKLLKTNKWIRAEWID